MSNKTEEDSNRRSYTSGSRGARERSKRNQEMTWTERKARTWRKNSKRGVSPIIATILLVAITVVLAAVLYILISGLTKGPGNTPLGTAFAMGSVLTGQSGTTFYENLTVESASGGITWNNINFRVVSTTGAIVGTV